MNFKKFLNPENYHAYIVNREIRGRLKVLGENVIFDPLSTILTPETIELHDNVFLGERAHLSGEITIQRNVMMGPRPVIVGGDHIFGVRGNSVRFLHPLGRETAEPVTLEEEVWCGACVLILGGVILGMGAVIGAGSVVSKSIPPFTVAAGNPCRPFARIFDDRNLQEHLVRLGKDPKESKAVVTRRINELKSLKVGSLKVVDKTAWYARVQSQEKRN